MRSANKLFGEDRINSAFVYKVDDTHCVSKKFLLKTFSHFLLFFSRQVHLIFDDFFSNTVLEESCCASCISSIKFFFGIALHYWYQKTLCSSILDDVQLNTLSCCSFQKII